MTYKSKRTLTSIVAGILLGIAYIVYALSHRAPTAGDLKGWAALMLVFIGVSVAALIVIQLLFHIGYSIGVTVKESGGDERNTERIVASAMVEDEMDKIISLKSLRIGYTCFGIGFIATLVALALGATGVVPLHILLGSVFLGSTIEGCVSVYLYERGVQHG